MFCKKCGKEIKNNTTFCSECGAKVEQHEVVQINQINATDVQSAMTSSSDTGVAVKKKSNKKILIIIGAIILFIIIIVATFGDDSESSSTGGTSIILENDNCQLGATYDFTPESFIKKYNNIVGVDNDGAVPNISEWASGDLLGDGDISYMYAFSKDIVYTINTYQNTKVSSVYCELSDDFIGKGVLFMAVLEASATGITDTERTNAMAQLISDKIFEEGYSSFVYKNSVITANGNSIIMGAVSDDILSTMDCYVISDSEF